MASSAGARSTKNISQEQLKRNARSAAAETHDEGADNRKLRKRKGKDVAGSQSKPKNANEARNNEAEAVHDAAPDEILRIAIDYGTAMLSAAYQVKRKGEDKADVHDVYFDNELEAPMVLFWDGPQKELLWGSEVMKMRLATEGRRPIAPEATIEFPKLALYRNVEQLKNNAFLESLRAHMTTIGQDLEQPDFDIEDLIGLHLKSVMKSIMADIAESVEAEYLKNDGKDILELPREVYISVPQAWDPSSNEIMAQAAREADIKKGQLVLEPQCVAAYIMSNEFEKFTQRKRGKPIIGSERLVVDAGGGTVDIARYELMSAPNSRCQLKTIGLPERALIGSATMNFAFAQRIIEYINENPPESTTSYESMRNVYGISDESFRRQAYFYFEDFKTRRQWTQWPVVMRFTGIRGVNIPVQFDLVDDIIKQGIKEVLSLIDKHFDPLRTSTVILSGGFGHSPALIDAVEKKYSSDRVRVETTKAPNGQSCLPVTHGALYRHDRIDMLGIPSRYCFFNVDNWDFDPEKHPDAAEDSSLQLDSQIGDKKVVADRTCVLIPKDQVTKDGDIFKASVWTQWRSGSSTELPVVWARIFWTEKDIIEDNKPLSDYTLHEDYEPWHDIRCQVPKEMLDNLKYKLTSRGNYLIDGRIILKACGAKVQMGFDLCRAGKFYQLKNLVGWTSIHLEQLWCEDAWNADFSSVPADLYKQSQNRDLEETSLSIVIDDNPEDEASIGPSHAGRIEPERRVRTKQTSSRLDADDGEPSIGDEDPTKRSKSNGRRHPSLPRRRIDHGTDGSDIASDSGNSRIALPLVRYHKGVAEGSDPDQIETESAADPGEEFGPFEDDEFAGAVEDLDEPIEDQQQDAEQQEDSGAMVDKQRSRRGHSPDSLRSPEKHPTGDELFKAIARYLQARAGSLLLTAQKLNESGTLLHGW
ncbi:hypothetical protein HII31_04029 [Pseudocercospora fuligena]|uniref:Uncharacterized protein n=1 Tax=Pseudocercospora fuligena TaxID=685502 RepID=A0A8H6RNS5_9PEZI|nr:hypothetical protein HII31_04029 [Pseudocercospora fuligena]